MEETVKMVASAATDGKPNIFDYQDYRKFLIDLIEHRKKRIKSYGRADFAKALGFASSSGLNMVLTGRRELRPPYLDRCIQNLKLPTSERLYFEAMIRMSSMSPSKRRSLLKEVEMLSSVWEPPARAEGIRLIDFFIVQQILCLNGSYCTAAEIKDLFRYGISLAEVQSILDWMLAKGYVNGNGAGYKILKSVMMVKDEYPNTNAWQMHIDSFGLAQQALVCDPIEDREFQTYIFTVDRRNIVKMKQRIKKLVLDIISEYETELDADTVVQMHFNLFEVVDKSKLRRNWN